MVTGRGKGEAGIGMISWNPVGSYTSLTLSLLSHVPDATAVKYFDISLKVILWRTVKGTESFGSFCNGTSHFYGKPERED